MALRTRQGLCRGRPDHILPDSTPASGDRTSDGGLSMQDTLRRVAIHTLALTLAYAAGIGFVFLFVAQPDLVQIVSACKIVSLIILVYANREIPHHIDLTNQTDLKTVNHLIVLFSVVVLILLTIKTLVQDYSLLQTTENGQRIIAFFSYNSYWISTMPVFLYCMLDIHIAFFRSSGGRDRHAAAEFVLFRDLVCAVPLALVLLVTETYRMFSETPDAAKFAELFFSGAIAVILLSYAIASRALDLLQARRQGPVMLVRRSGAVHPQRPPLEAVRR